MGIARSSEFPGIERITPRKLEVMDEFIRDKSAVAQSKRAGKVQEEKVEEKPEPPQEDMNEVKALPAPEEFKEEVIEEPEPVPEEPKVVQTEGDLLNLGDDDLVTRVEDQDQDNKMALALFDGAEPASDVKLALPWRAFDDGTDWETTLVQSASTWTNQKPALGGGFDSLLLDSMYKQGAMNTSMQDCGYGGGSASSLVYGSDGRSAPMLALPAPPSCGSGWVSTDPFAASAAIAPPPYVQMSEMENKQRLLMDEQLLWQQYARDNMHGQAGMARVHPVNYMGGYPSNYGVYYR